MYKRILAIVCLSVFSLGAWASKAQGPYEVVVETTDKVTAAIDDARAYVDQDPERFYREIEHIMDDVVDFNSFARGVMGQYGSKQYYDSLKTEAERAKFRERVVRFTETFKSRLIRTYAKGLMAFNGQRIEVVPLPADADLSGSVNIEQHIFSSNPQPYVVFYKLRQDRDGTWKLRNVSIEGINLGRTYQSQFAAAMERYNGDIDQVIDNWSVAPQEIAEKASEKGLIDDE